MKHFDRFQARFSDLTAEYDDEVARITCSDMEPRRRGEALVMASTLYCRRIKAELRIAVAMLLTPESFLLAFGLGGVVGILLGKFL
jgi:hypothetical protein